MGETLILLVTAFGGGVGITSIITAVTSKKKLDAEADNTNIKSILDIDARINERLSKLEERVAHLEDENFKLKEENMQLRYKLECKA